MAHTFANLLTHVIFSTKDRQPLLTPDLRTDLLAYMGGIVPTLRRQPCQEPVPRGKAQRHGEPRSHKRHERNRLRASQPFFQVVEIVAIRRPGLAEDPESFIHMDHGISPQS